MPDIAFEIAGVMLFQEANRTAAIIAIVMINKNVFVDMRIKPFMLLPPVCHLECA